MPPVSRGTCCSAGRTPRSAAGLDRSDTVWRVIGRAAALRGRHPDVPVLVVTTRPVHAEAAAAVRAAGPTIVHDVVVTGSVADLARLAMYAGGLRTSAPPGFRRETDEKSAVGKSGPAPCVRADRRRHCW